MRKSRPLAVESLAVHTKKSDPGQKDNRFVGVLQLAPKSDYSLSHKNEQIKKGGIVRSADGQDVRS